MCWGYPQLREERGLNLIAAGLESVVLGAGAGRARDDSLCV